jgi:hypothetical protein
MLMQLFHCLPAQHFGSQIFGISIIFRPCCQVGFRCSKCCAMRAPQLVNLTAFHVCSSSR